MDCGLDLVPFSNMQKNVDLTRGQSVCNYEDQVTLLFWCHDSTILYSISKYKWSGGKLVTGWDFPWFGLQLDVDIGFGNFQSILVIKISFLLHLGLWLEILRWVHSCLKSRNILELKFTRHGDLLFLNNEV